MSEAHAFGAELLDILDKLLGDLKETAILETVLIYDCERTKGEIFRINAGSPAISIVRTLGMEAGPLIRELDRRPLKRYGFALVMSKKSFLAVLKTMSKDGGMGIMGPRIIDLNKEESRG